MKVIVAQNCGFCPGVKNAISTAEKILSQENDVYSLGPIIHNKDMVDQLRRLKVYFFDFKYPEEIMEQLGC